MIGIYKITNTLNNKVYIGQSIDVETRWLQHLYKGSHNSSEGKLYPAMFSDGINNFKFEIIEECILDEKLLNTREKYWINYYNSYEEGYNSTRGGQGEDSWIYDPNLIHQLWDEGYSVGEIQKILGCGANTVHKRLKNYSNYNPNTSCSRGWETSVKNGNTGVIKINGQYCYNQRKECNLGKIEPVYQYDLDGNFLNEYPSINAAAKALGKFSQNIGTCLTNPKHYTAYGFQWSRIKTDKIPSVKERKKGIKS